MLYKKIDNTTFFAIIILAVAFACIGVANAYTLAQDINVAGDYNNYEAANQPAVNLGGSGTEHYQLNNFYDGMMVGGATSTITATTSANVLLLTAKQICDNDWIEITDAAVTAGEENGFALTFPTAALLNADCFRGSGMSKVGGLWIYNGSVGWATTTAGTGGELLEGDSLTVGIDPGNWVHTEIIMNSVGDRYILVSTEYQAGD